LLPPSHILHIEVLQRLLESTQDAYSLRSHLLAEKDRDGAAKDIVPIDVVQSDGSIQTVACDEGIRANSSMDKLVSLKPAFENDEMSARFPEINWSVTAASASQISDGASAILVMETAVAARLGFVPRAAVTHFAVSGDDPVMMLTGVIPATRKLLARAGLGIDSIDVYEVNEAFASVPLAWQKEFGTDPQRLNGLGGAIALGHPVGASGGRLIANLLRALEKSNGRYGLQTICESGGMANATLIERL
jgi:acetyl-CoA acetyltransferase family protein